MKKYILFGMLLMATVFTGCAKQPVSTDVSASEENVKFVQVANLEKRDFENTVKTASRLNPKEKVAVTAKVGGTVDYVKADLGQKVTKGSTLAKIDDTTYKLQHKNSKISLDKLKNNNESGLKPQEIQAVEAQFQTAKINYENVKDQFENTKRLYEEGAVSKIDYDNMKKQFDITSENYTNAQNNLKQANISYGFNLEAAKVGEELARESLINTTIKAPISGIISSKTMTTGENVNPGAPLFEIVNIDEMYVEAGVSEKDIASIAIDQIAKVTIDALGGEVFEGKVTHISPEIDERSSTYLVKIKVDNKDGRIKSGMFANLEIVLAEEKEKISVPKDIVIKKNDKRYVYVIENNFAVKKEIKLGLESDKYFEVEEGLTVEDKVVHVGFDKLLNGDQVLIQE